MKKLISILTVLLFGLYIFGWYYELTLPAAKGKASPKIIFIKPGTPFKEVARLLKEKGIIRSELGFIFEAYRLGLVNQLKAGEYELDPRDPPAKILRILAKGRVITHYVTIPEGYNIYEIARLLDKAGLAKRDDFLAVVTSPQFVAEFNIPGPTAEGFLFPDTYGFSKGMSPHLLAATMVRHFWEIWNKEFAKRAEEMGVSVKTVVTLASIVEKEAIVPRERPIIASVFWNRLKKGMKLQADPTVRYATKRFYRRLRYRDLRFPDPYNTYVYPGLPPGPICNPGKESIRAVLWPAKTDYLYFVSKGDGTHYFSRTLREHNLAVQVYQLGVFPPEVLKKFHRSQDKGQKEEKNGGKEKNIPER